MARDALVIDLARQQHGLVARWQALRAGLSLAAIDWRVHAGDWEPVQRAVYRLPGAVPTWHQRALALCLATFPYGVASHATAGWLWGLSGVADGPPEPIDLLVPHERQLTEAGARVRRTRVVEASRRLRFGIPVTPLPRTILNLAAVLRPAALEIALDSAMRFYGSGVRREIELRTAMLETPYWEGLSTLRALLSERNDALDSELEVPLRRLLLRSGLPRARHSYDVRDGRRFIAQVDFAWPHIKLAVQGHGLKDHLRPSRYRRDQVQQSELQAAGWLVLTTTWHEVLHDAHTFVSRVRRAFALAESRALGGPNLSPQGLATR